MRSDWLDFYGLETSTKTKGVDFLYVGCNCRQGDKVYISLVVAIERGAGRSSLQKLFQN